MPKLTWTYDGRKHIGIYSGLPAFKIYSGQGNEMFIECHLSTMCMRDIIRHSGNVRGIDRAKEKCEEILVRFLGD